MDTSYNSIQRVFNSCRYLIAKDSKAIMLLDIQRDEAQVILDIPFIGVYCGDDTLRQYVDHQTGHLHILTVGSNYDHQQS